MSKSEKDTLSVIDQVPEPENIRDVIHSMFAIPHLSPINLFDISPSTEINPSDLGKDDIDAGVFEIDGESKLFSLTIYADHRRLKVDPEVAAEIIVAKAVRSIACYGATPVALSAYLNHVELSDPVDQQIVCATRKGLDNAASSFGLQTSQRKIFYDYSGEHKTTPTLIVSLVGRLDSRESLMPSRFKKKGENIFLIGDSISDINASEYINHFYDVEGYPLMHFDLEFEKVLLKGVKGIVDNNLASLVRPVGIGGLFFTLLRASLPNGLGFDITTDAEVRSDAFLLGESMGRVIAGVEKAKENDFVDYMREQNIPFFTLGHVTKGEIRIDDASYGFIDKMTEVSS